MRPIDIFARLKRQRRKQLVSPSSKQTIAYGVLSSIIYSENSFFGRPDTKIICTLFPMCIKENTLKKSTKNCVASKFFT